MNRFFHRAILATAAVIALSYQMGTAQSTMGASQQSLTTIHLQAGGQQTFAQK
jgi:hypothetical protein